MAAAFRSYSTIEPFFPFDSDLTKPVKNWRKKFG